MTSWGGAQGWKLPKRTTGSSKRPSRFDPNVLSGVVVRLLGSEANQDVATLVAVRITQNNDGVWARYKAGVLSIKLRARPTLADARQAATAARRASGALAEAPAAGRLP